MPLVEVTDDNSGLALAASICFQCFQLYVVCVIDIFVPDGMQTNNILTCEAMTDSSF